MKRPCIHVVAGVLSLGLVAGCVDVDDPATTTTSTTTTTSAGTTTAVPTPLLVTSVAPAIVDPLGHSHLVVSGSGFAAKEGSVTEVHIGGVPATGIEVLSDTEVRIVSAAVAGGKGLDLEVRRGEASATLAGAVEAWSPAELDGARVFDTESGVETAEAGTLYEWQRLTASVGPGYRARDGNTTTWLPSTGRFWMVAGWNGYQEPEGFSTVPPDSVYPPENTSDEVWSSPDGATWTLELPHGNGQFERRHAHNTMSWKGKLWMIGGDHHQGYYNHDVVSSPDGVTWTVELGPGKEPPPWSERGLQVSGVYAGKLWTAGGQDMVGEPDLQVYHNDVWSTEDGVHWAQVAPDGPASDTRWGGCGVLDGLVELKGRMWLVGCARAREDAQGHTMSNEVWSTTDGAVWKLHAEPPWKGKIWPNVVVWDDKIWILFGFTYGDPAGGWPVGNSAEAWYSEDGETWRSLPVDTPVPGSHAQGVGVTEEFLLLAGGNYNFGFGAGVDNSTWRLVPYRGQAVTSWTDRGEGALQVTAPTEANRPLLVPDSLGPGIAGLQLDGSTSFLALAPAPPDAPAPGRSVFWVARAPYIPPPWGWVDTYNPTGTIVGGADESGYPVSSVGLTDGRIVFINREEGFDAAGSPIWKLVTGGSELQRGTGEVRLAGVTHAEDGTVQTWVDGEAAGPADSAYSGTPRTWSRIGAGIDGAGEGPVNRFSGTLGAVVILPVAADAPTVARLHAWAQGRFGAR